MKIKQKLLLVATIIWATFLFATGASASVGDIGTDTSVHNGYAVPKPYGKEKFNIAQAGGINNGYIYGQATYETQMRLAIAQNQRAHTYLWLEGGSTAISDQLANIFLPQIAAVAPKGSIVAVDYETNASGNKQANTDAVMRLMQRIKDAGFTPMLYGYKSFLQSNVYTDQVINRFGTSLWVGEYPGYDITPNPNYNFFPSMNGIALFQFTSTYAAPSLDASVDLTGITDNGYSKVVTKAPTVTQGKKEEKKESKAKTASFKSVYVVDKWVQYQGRWYGINNDMAKPAPVDYNQYMPVSAFTLTDRYGHKLNNQTIKGNDGSMEYAVFEGHYKILERSGDYIKIDMNGEPVWLSANFVSFD